MRPQITAVNHYDVFPFNHGGSLGIRGLYKALSEWFDVNIVTFLSNDSVKREVKISKHIRVISIQLPEDILKKINGMYEEYGMGPDTMVDSSPACIRWFHENDYLKEQVREIAKDSEIVIAEHVFTWNLIKAACPEKHLWYRANNVEYDYKRTTWDKIGCPQDLLKETYECEKECCNECEKVLTVSQLESDRFVDLYNIDLDKKGKFMNIRSGYDVEQLRYVKPSERKYRFDGYKMAGVFVASNTTNTRIAARNCIEIANQCPDILFILLGGVGYAFKDIEVPKNVLITGIVPDSERDFYLMNCDFALNLLEDGAGINVKMFEYFAFGIPIVSTIHGARGIEITDGVNCIITSKGNYLKDIRKFSELSIEQRDGISEAGLQLLKEKYSWRNIGREIVMEIKRMYGIEVEKNALPLEEIELTDFSKEKPYIPRGDYYIRCIGDWGTKCLKELRKHESRPVGIIDENPELVGKEIDGIPIISVEEFFKTDGSSEVIVATWPLCTRSAELVERGLPIERISLAWEGIYIVSLDGFIGNFPYYFEPQRWKSIIERILDGDKEPIENNW